MNDDKIAELQRLFTKQENELLQSLATIRKQMAIINGETPLFRLYINNYTKNPIYYAHLFNDDGKQTDARMSCKTTDEEKAGLYADVPYHSRDIAPVIIKSILKQAGL
jgi:hypothetical protein